MMKRRHFHGGETFTQCPEESGGSQHEQVAPAVVTSTHVDENRLKTDGKYDTARQRYVANEAALFAEWLINK